MINCKEASKLASEQLDHPIGFRRKVLLVLHLKMCDACNYFGKQIKGLKDLLSSSNKSTQPLTLNTSQNLSEEKKISLQEKIKQELR